MTSKNISANITIGGSVSSSLGKSFGAVRKSLQGISGELKNLKEHQKFLEQQADAAKKAGKSTAEYEKQLKKLAQTQANLQSRSGRLKSVSGMFARPQGIQFGAVSSAILSKMATSKSMGGITTASLGLIAEYGPALMMVGTAAAAAAAALLAFGGAAFLLGKSAAGIIDKTADMADGLGVTTEALQRLRHVAALSGIDTDTFDTKLGKLTVSLESAKDGTGPTAAALNELGLSYMELSAMSPDEQLIAISTAMKKYNGNMPKMSIGQALFGKNSAKFVNMMNQGGDAIREAGKNASVFSKEQIKQAEDFDIAWHSATASFQTAWVGIATQIMPAVTAALDDVIAWLKDPANMESMMAFGQGMKDLFTGLIPILKATADFLITIVDAISYLGKIGDEFNAIFGYRHGKFQGGSSLLGGLTAGQESELLKTGTIKGSESMVTPELKAQYQQMSLPSNITSGASSGAGGSTLNKTTNNSPVQNNVINVYGATNTQQMVEQMNQAVGSWSARMSTLALD